MTRGQHAGGGLGLGRAARRRHYVLVTGLESVARLAGPFRDLESAAVWADSLNLATGGHVLGQVVPAEPPGSVMGAAAISAASGTYGGSDGR